MTMASLTSYSIGNLSVFFRRRNSFEDTQERGGVRGFDTVQVRGPGGPSISDFPQLVADIIEAVTETPEVHVQMKMNPRAETSCSWFEQVLARFTMCMK